MLSERTAACWDRSGPPSRINSREYVKTDVSRDLNYFCQSIRTACTWHNEWDAPTCNLCQRHIVFAIKVFWVFIFFFHRFDDTGDACFPGNFGRVSASCNKVIMRWRVYLWEQISLYGGVTETRQRWLTVIWSHDTQEVWLLGCCSSPFSPLEGDSCLQNTTCPLQQCCPCRHPPASPAFWQTFHST